MPNLRRDLPGWATTRERRVMWLLDEKKLSRRSIAESLNMKYGAVCRIVRKLRGNRHAYRQGAAPKVTGADWPSGVRPFAALDDQGKKKRQWLLERTHRLRDQEGLTLEQAQARHPKDGKKLLAYLWAMPAGFDLYEASLMRGQQTEQGQLWDGQGLDPHGDKPWPTCRKMKVQLVPKQTEVGLDPAKGVDYTAIQINSDVIRVPQGATVRIKRGERGEMDIEVTV